MARAVDPRRTRKAQRLIDKLKRAKEEAPEPYSGWEDTFLDEVGQRLETYGSAFRDLAKGAPDEAVSRAQAQKLREIARKAAGKDGAGFARSRMTTKKPLRARKPKA